MSYRIKRLRVFAGSNGSGKSTLFEYLLKIHAFHLYFHINADIIAKDLFQSCDMNNFPFHFTEDELRTRLTSRWFHFALLIR
jgi:predicted ABC-type ATPase